MDPLEQKYTQITEEALQNVDNPAVKGELLNHIAELLLDGPSENVDVLHAKYNGTALKVEVIRGSMRYVVFLTADVASSEPIDTVMGDEDEETPQEQEKNGAAYDKALRTATTLANQYQSKGMAGKAMDKITGGAGSKAVQAVKQAGNLAVTSLQKQNQRLAQSLNSGS